MGREEGRRGTWAEAVPGDSEIRAGLPSPPRVPVAGGSPGALAGSAGPGTAGWPAHAMEPFPPLALGGMGGGALRMYLTHFFNGNVYRHP